MISWLYRPRAHFDNDSGFGLFLLELFLIPLYLGILFRSIFLFLYLLVAIIIGVFYFNFRILIFTIGIIGIIVIAGFGWIIGELFSNVFSTDAKLVGGILGAMLFGLIGFGYNAHAFSLIDSREDRITLNRRVKIDLIVYLSFIIGFPLLFTGLIFPGINPITYISGPPQNLPDSCIGTCFIGQNATDGYFNDQKIRINRVFYLKQPYVDPQDPVNDKIWHNWDWILLDVSLTNTNSEKPIQYHMGELTDVTNQKYWCFPGGFGGASVELTDFDIYTPLNVSETRRGNISCSIDPHAIRPLKYDYRFDNGYSDKGKHAVFLIDKFDPLDYNSIKSSLKGDKPF
jgi:hypothetical protein